MPGDQAELKVVFMFRDRYSLVAVITTEGSIASHVIPGSFNAFTMVHMWILLKVKVNIHLINMFIPPLTLLKVSHHVCPYLLS